MTARDHSSRALFDGALPLVFLLLVAALIGRPAIYAVTTLYLVFAAGIATGGADRPGEPSTVWRLYALGMALLAAAVPLGGAWVAPGLVLFATGFVVHLVEKGAHGVCRVGILSACGRRDHDARVGRTLEAAALALAGAAASAFPALYAVAGWLVTAAAVAERPTSGPGDRPLAAVPAPAA